MGGCVPLFCVVRDIDGVEGDWIDDNRDLPASGFVHYLETSFGFLPW